MVTGYAMKLYMRTSFLQPEYTIWLFKLTRDWSNRCGFIKLLRYLNSIFITYSPGCLISMKMDVINWLWNIHHSGANLQFSLSISLSMTSRLVQKNIIDFLKLMMSFYKLASGHFAHCFKINLSLKTDIIWGVRTWVELEKSNYNHPMHTCVLIAKAIFNN